jgi:hypothetical protein
MGRQQDMEEQIAFALRQAESGTSVAEIIRRFGVDPSRSNRPPPARDSRAFGIGQ